MQNQGLGRGSPARRANSPRADIAISARRPGRTATRSFAEPHRPPRRPLRTGGAAKGDRIVTTWDNHPDFLTTFFACGAIGAIFVPLNTRARTA